MNRSRDGAVSERMDYHAEAIQLLGFLRLQFRLVETET